MIKKRMCGPKPVEAIWSPRRKPFTRNPGTPQRLGPLKHSEPFVVVRPPRSKDHASGSCGCQSEKNQALARISQKSRACVSHCIHRRKLTVHIMGGQSESPGSVLSFVVAKVKLILTMYYDEKRGASQACTSIKEDSATIRECQTHPMNDNIG